MRYRLDQAFDLERRSDTVLHRDDCDPAWNIGGQFINGGYLQGINAHAVAEVIDPNLDHLAVSTVFSAQVNPGPFDIEVDVAKVGRRISSATARIVQGGSTRVTSLVTLGRLPENLDDTYVEQQMPDVPPIDDCPDLSGEKGAPAMREAVDMRFVPGLGLERGMEPANDLYCWVRFRDNRPLDSLSLVAFSDIGPPVGFAQGNFGWAPTLQMQVTTFCRPVGDAVLMRIYGSPYGSAPYGCEDVDLWDTAGTLVARGRQIAMPPQPKRDDHGKVGH